jgi:hypothetical protein
LFGGTAVIFLGAGASVGDDSERAAGKGVPGSGALTEAVAEQFDIQLKYDADGNLLSALRPVASLAVNKRDESTVTVRFSLPCVGRTFYRAITSDVLTVGGK